jgi:pimeloyl-ACP methyl ester carboxylesterase
MKRRTFLSMVAAGAAGTLVQGTAVAALLAPKSRNVVLVHGLFADGSSWSEVIARLQAAGLNATSVQNPLTTLPEAVTSAERVLARQDGPTVLVGHSFSGMIVTEAGMHPNVSALVYVAARAPDAGEDYAALAKTYPTPPASAGIVFDGDEGRLSEEAFLRDFAGDCRKRRRRRFMRSSGRSKRHCLRARRRRRPGGQSRVSMRYQRKTARSIPISNASWPSGWAPRPSK